MPIIPSNRDLNPEEYFKLSERIESEFARRSGLLVMQVYDSPGHKYSTTFHPDTTRVSNGPLRTSLTINSSEFYIAEFVDSTFNYVAPEGDVKVKQRDAEHFISLLLEICDIEGVAYMPTVEVDTTSLISFTTTNYEPVQATLVHPKVAGVIPQLFSYTNLGLLLDRLRAEPVDNMDPARKSCRAACTGLCLSACGTSCTAACGTNCSTGCSGSCTNSCFNLCQSSCADSCTVNCSGACDNFCTESCANACMTNCSSACINTCWLDCVSSCAHQCYGGCTTTCADDCTAACDMTCDIGCYDGCQSGCTGCTGCGNTCESTCQGTCLTECNEACAADCGSGCGGSCINGCGKACGTTCTGTCTGSANADLGLDDNYVIPEDQDQ